MVPAHAFVCLNTLAIHTVDAVQNVYKMPTVVALKLALITNVLTHVPEYVVSMRTAGCKITHRPAFAYLDTLAIPLIFADLSSQLKVY